MSGKRFSVLGIFAAILCLGAGTTFYSGGFDWNRDFISTMLRGPSGPARTLADAGVLLFCLSIALVFNRLSQTEEFSKNSMLIRIGGIGAMVYSAFTITPLHDLMVTISAAFFLAAAVPMVCILYDRRETAFFIAGCVCLTIFCVSVTIYYSGAWGTILPWAQRISHAVFAAWLVSLDFAFPRRATEGALAG